MTIPTDWATWTAAQEAAAFEEIETFPQGDIWVALRHRVYDGEDCRREKLLEEGKGPTPEAAIAHLKPISA